MRSKKKNPESCLIRSVQLLFLCTKFGDYQLLNCQIFLKQNRQQLLRHKSVSQRTEHSPNACLYNGDNTVTGTQWPSQLEYLGVPQCYLILSMTPDTTVPCKPHLGGEVLQSQHFLLML